MSDHPNDRFDDSVLRIVTHDYYLGPMKKRHDTLVRATSDILVVLIQNYAQSGPWLLRASAEYTAGIKEFWTPHGRVVVECVLGGAKCFELRELPELK